MKYDHISKFLDNYALKQKVQRPQTEEDFASSQKAEAHEEKSEKIDIKFHETNWANFLQDINKHEKMVMVHIYKDEEFQILKDVTEKFQYVKP